MRKAARTVFTAVLLSLFCILAACSSPPAAPSGLSAVLTQENTIHLEWAASPDAETYRLFRKADDTQNYKFLCDLTATEYTDTDISAGCTYRYQIQALSDSGTSGGVESEPLTLPLPPESGTTQNLTVPVITSVTQMDRYTNVILFESTNVECEYEVLRADSADSEFISLGVTDETAFYDISDEAGSWFYAVRAVQSGQYSPLSTPVAAGTNAKAVFGVPVFMYHEFVTQEDLDNGVAFDEYAIWQDEFESDLIWLRDNGYTTITTRQLADWLNGAGTLPKKPVLLTIDDGKLGVYKRAWPLLQKYNMTVSLAVIGSRIDMATLDPEGRLADPAPYSTWEEIGEMSASGHVEIISHTYGLHIFHHNGRQGANCAEGETVTDYYNTAQKDYAALQQKLALADCPQTIAQAYPYSIRSQVSDQAWLQCGYQILLAGDGSDVSRTHMNFYIQEAGINSHSALTRRLVRMTGTPISAYIEAAIEHDLG